MRRFWWSIIHALESGLRLDACNVRDYLYLCSYSLHQNWKSICARLISSSWSRFYIISYVLSLWLRLVFFLLYRFLNNRNNPLWVQPCSIATAKFIKIKSMIQVILWLLFIWGIQRWFYLVYKGYISFWDHKNKANRTKHLKAVSLYYILYIVQNSHCLSIKDLHILYTSAVYLSLQLVVKKRDKSIQLRNRYFYCFLALISFDLQKSCLIRIVPFDSLRYPTWMNLIHSVLPLIVVSLDLTLLW